MIIRDGTIKFRSSPNRRQLASGIVAAAAVVSLAGPALSQEYPNRPIQLVVPYSAGGGTDIVARYFATVAANYLDVPIRVVTMPGAGGTRGTRYVAESAPDGYTLVFGTLGSQLTSPIIQDVGYQPEDFEPVSIISAPSFMIVVEPDSELTDFAAFVEHVRANPGQVRYGSSGAGGSAHYMMALLSDRLGLEMVHVPFNGSSEAVANVMGGHVETAAPSTGSAAGGISAGNLRALVHTASNDLSAFPDVPSMQDAGYDFVFYTWRGIFAPKGTPEEVLEVLDELSQMVGANEEFRRLVSLAEGEETAVIARAQFIDQYAREIVDARRIAPTLN